MKNISSILLMLCITFVGCAPHTTQAITKRLQGTWKLTATLNDIGDGKATWKAAGGNAYAKFNSDGSISGTALTEATNYQITDSTHMALTIKNNAQPVAYRYQLKANMLLLQPPCREACGIRFIRIK